MRSWAPALAVALLLAFTVHGRPAIITGGATPGGSASQVQYNSGGAFAGITNVQSDGQRLSITGETTHPSTPASNALSYNFLVAASAPPQDMERDPALGIPIPKAYLGMLNTAANRQLNWMCARIEHSGTGSSFALLNIFSSASLIQLGAASLAWSNASLILRLPWLQFQSAAAAGSSADIASNFLHSWRGNTAGAGGFIMTTRVAIVTPQANSRTFFGMNGTVASIGNVEPNTLLDSIYIGSNAGDANLSICSNDNSGTATCNTLGANFPAQTGNAMYDIAFWAAPNGSSISYSIDRFDSAQHADGVVSSDLPRNTVQLAWQDWINNGTTALTARGYWGGTCVLDNF